MTSTTPAAKFGELLVLGGIIGLLSMGASSLWREYELKISDLTQYVFADVLQNYRLHFPLVVIDIGESTCKEWTERDDSKRDNIKYDHGGECAFLSRFPHKKLADMFTKLGNTWRPRHGDIFSKRIKPKLVVVDIDLRSEVPDKPNDSEKRIRLVVEHKMHGIPLVVAQPLLRSPKQELKQYYDYKPIKTILHALDKPKEDLRFGQVEHDLLDDSVLRRFRATIPLASPDTFDADPSRKEHLALEVCELVHDKNLCGRHTLWHKARELCEFVRLCGPAPKLTFGAHPVSPDEPVQFRYLLARDVDRLINWGVPVIEARAVLARSFDASALDNAVVIIGSTARGRGDYHFTPLDSWDHGETAGVIIVANEVVAALENQWLQEASWGWEVFEKFILIFISTTIIVVAFWVPWLRWHSPVSRSRILRFSYGTLFYTHFIFVAVGVILINLILDGFVFFKFFNLGEIVDPVTPVVAAILDIIVDISTDIGHRLGPWLDLRLGRFWSAFS